MPVCGFCSRMCEATFVYRYCTDAPEANSDYEDDPRAQAAARLGGGPIIRERNRHVKMIIDGIRRRPVC